MTKEAQVGQSDLAHEYRLLQAAALVKLYREGRWDETRRQPIDPSAILSRDEIKEVLGSY
jgi:hypothetical protein